MKINRMNYTQVISKLEKNKGDTVQAKQESGKDSISISRESIKLNEYMKNMKSDDAKKVERIKAQLENGTYRVDSGKLAEKILDRMKSQEHED